MIQLLTHLCLISGSLCILNKPHRHSIQERFYQEMIETIHWRQPVCMMPAPGTPPCLMSDDFMERYFTAKAWEAKISWPDPRQPTAVHEGPTPRRVIGLEELEPRAIQLPEDNIPFTNYEYTRASKRSKRHHNGEVGSNMPPPITVTRVVNSPVTATIVAHNCVPQIGVPFCGDYGTPNMPTKINIDLPGEALSEKILSWIQSLKKYLKKIGKSSESYVIKDWMNIFRLISKVPKDEKQKDEEERTGSVGVPIRVENLKDDKQIDMAETTESVDVNSRDEEPKGEELIIEAERTESLDLNTRIEKQVFKAERNDSVDMNTSVEKQVFEAERNDSVDMNTSVEKQVIEAERNDSLHMNTSVEMPKGEKHLIEAEKIENLDVKPKVENQIIEADKTESLDMNAQDEKQKVEEEKIESLDVNGRIEKPGDEKQIIETEKNENLDIKTEVENQIIETESEKPTIEAENTDSLNMNARDEKQRVQEDKVDSPRTKFAFMKNMVSLMSKKKKKLIQVIDEKKKKTNDILAELTRGITQLFENVRDEEQKKFMLAVQDLKKHESKKIPEMVPITANKTYHSIKDKLLKAVNKIVTNFKEANVIQDYHIFPFDVHPGIHHPNESNVDTSRPPKGNDTAQFSPDQASVDPIDQEAVKTTSTESIPAGQNTPPIAASNDTINGSIRPTSDAWKPTTTYQLKLQYFDNSTFAQPANDTSDFVLESDPAETEIVPPEQTSNLKEPIKSDSSLDEPNKSAEESVNKKESTLDPEVSPAAVDQALNQFLPPQKDPIDEVISLSSTSESTLLDITAATVEPIAVESSSPGLKTVNETEEKDLSVAKVGTNDSSIDNASQTVGPVNETQTFATFAEENTQRDTKCNGMKCDDGEKAKTDFNPQNSAFQIADNVWIVEKRFRPGSDNSKRSTADLRSGRRKRV